LDKNKQYADIYSLLRPQSEAGLVLSFSISDLILLACYTNQFKKPLNKKDGSCKPLISRCFVAQAGVLTHSCAEGKTPALPLLSPSRPQGGSGCRYQLFYKLVKTSIRFYFY